MSTQPAARRWTYEEFARLPDDGNRYEVIGGELFVTASPRPIHQEITGRISDLLRPFVKQHNLGRALSGPIDVLFAEGDFLAPDFIYVRQDRVHLVSDRGVEGAPDLVVEIVSDSTQSRDRGLKRRRYAAFGVAEYWIVDWRRKHVEIHRTTDDKTRQTEIATTSFDWQPISGGPVLTIDVAELLDDF
ncbi:MAG TPA: Uma2 family endonuclease [Longimicrobium sp.]|nr:Uma2 family endonuclease [Longimicrobium sp.]